MDPDHSSRDQKNEMRRKKRLIIESDDSDGDVDEEEWENDSEDEV